MKRFLTPVLIGSILLQSNIYAGALSIEPVGMNLPEQVKITTEDLNELQGRVEAFDPGLASREIVGGRIINKADGAEIVLECSEMSPNNECLKAQFVHKIGIASKNLSVGIDLKALIDFMQTFKTKMLSDIEMQKKQMPDGFVYFPVSNYAYGGMAMVNETPGEDVAGGFAIGGLVFGGISLLTAIARSTGGYVWSSGVVIGATMLTNIQVILCMAAIAVLWPVMTDLAILPVRGAAHLVKKISVGIHNRKLKKRMARIQKALNVTLMDGNRSVELRGSDFEYLLQTFNPPVVK